MNLPAKDYFRALEDLAPGAGCELDEFIDKLPFSDAGLLPAIAQDCETGEVLMLAWMNRTALEQTISTGMMTYWSRSRQSLWVKGKSSGNFQLVKSMRFDCDGDTILCQIDQKGSACHTGRRSCFYLCLNATQGRVHLY